MHTATIAGAFWKDRGKWVINNQRSCRRVEEVMVIGGKSPSAFPLLLQYSLVERNGALPISFTEQRDSSGLELRGYAKRTVVECSYC